MDNPVIFTACTSKKALFKGGFALISSIKCEKIRFESKTPGGNESSDSVGFIGSIYNFPDSVRNFKMADTGLIWL